MKPRLFLLASLACLVGCVPQAPVGTDKAMLSFAFDSPPASSEIDQQTRAITVTVPSATDLSSLVALFTFTGASVCVGDVKQESGLTENDFTKCVEYIVTAEDGSSLSYAVNVTRASPPSTEKAITSFAILNPAAAGRIEESSHVIRLSVPHGTDRAAMVASFITTGALVTVQDVPQESDVTANDFTEPVEYVVTAEDGTAWTYTVTVECLASGEKTLTRFTFGIDGVASVIDQVTGVVRVRVPPDTDLTTLIARFETTGAAVSVGGVVQESGVTVNDFTGPVDYTVCAEDGSNVVYGIRVTACIALLINELDVDQVGTDTAEFVELLALADVDLEGVLLVLLNGGVTPGQEYARIDLSRVGVLSSGTYLVVAGSNVSLPPDSIRFTPTGWESSNRIQNGPNDAVMLWDAIGRRKIDTVSYNGTLHRALIVGDPTEWDATEGSAGAPADSNSVAGSLSRSPNGQDTGQNGVDFRFTAAMTPGAPNG
jgi:hypothetical protein